MYMIARFYLLGYTYLEETYMRNMFEFMSACVDNSLIANSMVNAMGCSGISCNTQSDS